MSDYITFTDPVFLAHFGLSRSNCIEYFLLSANPFRTKSGTSNETLHMQGTSITLLMQHGHQMMYHSYGGAGMIMPMSLKQAEFEYNKALQQMTGEQYELLPPTDPTSYDIPQDLFTIRHVLRTSPTSAKILGVYYIVQGVIYKSPTIRSLMKSNVARVVDSLSSATSTLSVCARYLPSTGYTFNFEGGETEQDNEEEEEDYSSDDDDEDDEQEVEDNNNKDEAGATAKPKKTAEKVLSDEENPVTLIKLIKRHKRRKILDNRPPGERSEAEEEGLRATQAMDQILIRLNKTPYVTGPSTSSSATAGASSSKRTASSLVVLSSSAVESDRSKRRRRSGIDSTNEDDIISVAEPSVTSSTTGILSTK